MIPSLVVGAILLGSGPVHPVHLIPTHRGDDPAVRIWLNRNGRYRVGDRAKVQVQTRGDGYLIVLHVDPYNRLRVLFPLDPGDDNFVRGGKRIEIVGRGGRQAFTVEARSGRGTVYAAISPDPFHFDALVAGGQWDLRALDSVRISKDREADLNDVVRRIAQSDFDYDLFSYSVSQYVAYGYPYYPGYFGYPYYPGYLGYSYYPGYFGYPFYPGFGGPRVFVGLGFGHGFGGFGHHHFHH